LKGVTIRLANASSTSSQSTPLNSRNDILTFPPTSKFEVLSLVGTLSTSGSHIHISIGDDKGVVWGGHLVDGVVNTTLEIVVGVSDVFGYDRIMDGNTGFKELQVIPLRGGGREGEVGYYGMFKWIMGFGIAAGTAGFIGGAVWARSRSR
jgi:predicted DNA-binding protein with PD1-like motif